jgi:hypothetical protein
MTGTTQQRTPELFDLTVNDTIMDAHRETERELEERGRQARRRKVAIREIVVNHMGPSGASSMDQSYVDSMVRQAIPQPKSTPAEPVYAPGWQQPPGAPGPGADPIIASVSGEKATSGKAVKMLAVRKSPYGTKVVGRAADRERKANELILHMQPGPPETPAGMAPPPGGGPPPPPGRGRISRIKTDRFKKPDPNLIRDATRLKGKQAAELARAGARSKMDPEPIPEKLTPPRAASVPKAAKARAKSRSASRTPGAASSSSSAAAETTTVPPAESKPTKRLRSKSKPITPPVDVIVAPRPTRGRSIGTGPASRRIGSESRPPPIDPFAGPAQRLRSRTPAPKSAASSSSAAATVETGESSGKSRKQEVGETAAKKPLTIPSKMKTSQIAEELKDLVKNKGWNQKDADRLMVLQKQVADDPSTARDASIEMQVIYKRNYNNLKKAH